MRTMNMDEAACVLRRDGVLIYPTETYFAIGCRVGSDEAISRIFKVKRRLYAMPLPLIVRDAAQADEVAHIPAPLREDVRCLQEAFWPGPLSLIVPTRLSPLLTGGTGNIALRVSPHPIAGALLDLTGEALVASSANISGQAPATRVTQLSAELLTGVDGVCDAQPEPAGGAPSTLVEPRGDKKLIIHRLGAIREDRLQALGFILEQKV